MESAMHATNFAYAFSVMLTMFVWGWTGSTNLRRYVIKSSTPIMGAWKGTAATLPALLLVTGIILTPHLALITAHLNFTANLPMQSIYTVGGGFWILTFAYFLTAFALQRRRSDSTDFNHKQTN